MHLRTLLLLVVTDPCSLLGLALRHIVIFFNYLVATHHIGSHDLDPKQSHSDVGRFQFGRVRCDC